MSPLEESKVSQRYNLKQKETEPVFESLTPNSISLWVYNDNQTTVQETIKASKSPRSSQKEDQGLPDQEPMYGVLSIEDALSLVTSEPDNYLSRNLLMLQNLISALCFGLMMCAVFLFQEPEIYCEKEGVQKPFRCSVKEACHTYQNFSVDHVNSLTNLVSKDQDLCLNEDLSTRQVFSIIAAALLLSFLVSGILGDRWGRKKVVVVKLSLLLILLTGLVITGFAVEEALQMKIGLYLATFLGTTATFDLTLQSIENTTADKKALVLLTFQITRMLVTGLVILTFQLLRVWHYILAMFLGLLLVLFPFYLKFSLESIRFLYCGRQRNLDCQEVINRIAVANDEDPFIQALQFKAQPRVEGRKNVFQSLLALLRNKENRKKKCCFITAIAILSFQWIGFFITELIHILFLEDFTTDNATNIAIFATTEILGSFACFPLLRYFERKTLLLLGWLTMAVPLFLMLVLPENLAVEFSATIISRAALSLQFNVLFLFSLEQFPSQIRMATFCACLSFGLLLGVGLPFAQSLNSAFLIFALFILLNCAVTILFTRETSKDKALPDFSRDLFEKELEEKRRKQIKHQKLERADVFFNPGSLNRINKKLREEQKERLEEEERDEFEERSYRFENNSSRPASQRLASQAVASNRGEERSHRRIMDGVHDVGMDMGGGELVCQEQFEEGPIETVQSSLRSKDGSIQNKMPYFSVQQKQM